MKLHQWAHNAVLCVYVNHNYLQSQVYTLQEQVMINVPWIKLNYASTMSIRKVGPLVMPLFRSWLTQGSKFQRSHSEILISPLTGLLFCIMENDGKSVIEDQI